MHKSQTGKQIGSVPDPDNRICKVLSISSNGGYLAAGMDNGDVIFYFAGETSTFEDIPPRLI